MLDDSWLPIVNPSYRREGEQVFFDLVGVHRSRRPILNLARETTALFDALDGTRSVAELAARYPDAARALGAWEEAGVLAFMRPGTPSSGRVVLAIEPHMDDVALSMGGVLLARRGAQRIVLCTVTRRSRATSYVAQLGEDKFDVDAVTRLRTKETKIFCGVMQAESICFDYEDRPLLTPHERWRDVRPLAVELAEVIASLRPDEVWFPLGLGPHADHLWTRDATLEALRLRAGEPLPEIYAYEDMPYAARVSRAHVERLLDAFAQAGAELERATQDITDVFDDKLALARIYASQFKAASLGLREAAAREGRAPGRLAEAFYAVRRVPERPLSDFADLPAFRRAMERSRTLTIIATRPIDALGLVRLRSTFPSLGLRVLTTGIVNGSALAGLEGLEVKKSPGLGGLLPRLLSREALRFRAPTIVVGLSPFPSGLGELAVKLLSRLFLGFRPRVLTERFRDVVDRLVAPA